jgi:hypothetical protein
MAHDTPTTEELLAHAQAAIRRGHEDLENFARRLDAVEKQRQEFDSLHPHWQTPSKPGHSRLISHA